MWYRSAGASPGTNRLTSDEGEDTLADPVMAQFAAAASAPAAVPRDARGEHAQPIQPEISQHDAGIERAQRQRQRKRARGHLHGGQKCRGIFQYKRAGMMIAACSGLAAGGRGQQMRKFRIIMRGSPRASAEITQMRGTGVGVASGAVVRREQRQMVARRRDDAAGCAVRGKRVAGFVRAGMGQPRELGGPERAAVVLNPRDTGNANAAHLCTATASMRAALIREYSPSWAVQLPSPMRPGQCSWLAPDARAGRRSSAGDGRCSARHDRRLPAAACGGLVGGDGHIRSRRLAAEPAIQQRGHLRVACAPARLVQGHADQDAAVAHRAVSGLMPGKVGVTGLHAGRARIELQHAVYCCR